MTSAVTGVRESLTDVTVKARRRLVALQFEHTPPSVSASGSKVTGGVSAAVAADKESRPGQRSVDEGGGSQGEDRHVSAP